METLYVAIISLNFVVCYAVDMDLIELEVKVEGMMCDGCVGRIQTALEVPLPAPTPPNTTILKSGQLDLIIM